MSKLSRSHLPVILLAVSTWCSLGCTARDKAEGAALCVEPVVEHTSITVAGTGAALPLVRALAQRWRAHRPTGSPIDIPGSLGSSGGVRALRDGVIEVALISRPLKSEEREGLVVHPLARTPLVFATQGASGGVRAQELEAIYSGVKLEWENGRRIVPLFREEGDSGHARIATWRPSFGRMASSRGMDASLGLLAYSDTQLLDALVSVDGAIGWVDLGVLSLTGAPVEPLVLDGKDPRADAEYPLWRTLYAVTREDAPEEVRELVAWMVAVVSGGQGAHSYFPPTP
ncbi:MAG: substrate-binding domain-containing protein [Myxococcota bacterium]